MDSRQCFSPRHKQPRLQVQLLYHGNLQKPSENANWSVWKISMKHTTGTWATHSKPSPGILTQSLGSGRTTKRVHTHPQRCLSEISITFSEFACAFLARHNLFKSDSFSNFRRLFTSSSSVSDVASSPQRHFRHLVPEISHLLHLVAVFLLSKSTSLHPHSNGFPRP